MRRSRPPSCPLALLIGAGLSIALGVPAVARARAVAVETQIGVVSDYRSRGIPLSGGKASLQGGITAVLSSGAYGSVAASTVDDLGAGANGKGAPVGIDYGLGWRGPIGGFNLDIGAAAHTFPGGDRINYMEIPVSASRTVADWTWTLGGAYAPPQAGLGHIDNSYGYGQVDWIAADSGVTLTVSAGYERGAVAPRGKWDWSAGATRSFGPIKAQVSYVGVDEAFGDDAVIASLKATF